MHARVAAVRFRRLVAAHATGQRKSLFRAAYGKTAYDTIGLGTQGLRA